MINLLVALKSEARPLIERFSLSRVAADSRPRLFEGPGLCLAISGIGKTAATTAVSALVSLNGQEEEQGWVNLGLAGHRDHELGRAFLAHKVEDAVSGQVWRPPPVFGVGLPRAAVLTVEEPELEYPLDVLYDMEASAFLAATSQYSRPELAQVLKVVSDNLQRPTRLLTAMTAAELMRQQMPAIEELIWQVRRLL
jgi:hypothetical protein